MHEMQIDDGNSFPPAIDDISESVICSNFESLITENLFIEIII